MANHRLLNNVDHADLKVRSRRCAELGDAVHYAIAYPSEFRNLQAHYPIFFHRDAGSGTFHAVAMLGFEKGENLFLTDTGPDKGPNAGTGWDADYIPLSVERGPFMIGFEPQDGSPVLHIDMDSPRLSSTEGNPIFLPHGGHTPYLERMMTVLNQLHQGHQMEQAFMETLLDMDLLEPLTLDLELDDGSQNRLAGFHVIHEEALYGLDGDGLARLNAANYLLPVYMAVASLSRIKPLIDRKNARRRAGLG
ncbi:SapC family protein [Yunchengibacter salinarum]|uniref:SapC family protein n=1 Tax=Yunchengibacter salinarum TaxID=3133399 RepID=UPI0035B5DB92